MFCCEYGYGDKASDIEVYGDLNLVLMGGFSISVFVVFGSWNL